MRTITAGALENSRTLPDMPMEQVARFLELATEPVAFDDPPPDDVPEDVPGPDDPTPEATTIYTTPNGSQLTDARCACGVELYRDELARGTCEFCQ